MTTPSTARKAGPLLGTGSQTAWPFTFKVFAAGDIQVVIADDQHVQTVLVLDTDYTVALNTNQETSPGGTVTYPISGAALPVGSVLVIVGGLDYDQPLDLPSGGNFNPLALENQLDRATMQIQQIKEEVDRSAKLPVTYLTEDLENFTADIVRLADSADNIDTVANNIDDVNLLVDNMAGINTVAGIATDVTEVATNSNEVQVVAADLGGVRFTNDLGLITDPVTGPGTTAPGAITTVAIHIAEVQAVAGDMTNIDAVAADLANIDTVAGNTSNVNTVATNISAVSNTSANMAAVIDAPNQAAAAAASAAAAAAVVASGMYSAVQDKSANYTVVVGDAGDLIRMTTSGGVRTVTLPAISTVPDGFNVTVVKWTGDTNGVTVQRSSTDLINGSTSYVLDAQYKAATFVADAQTSTWFASGSGGAGTSVVVDSFNGTGSQTAFTLSGDPGSENNTQVFVSGVYQEKDTYSVSGATLTFSSAPPAGTSNIEIIWSQPLAIGVPADGSVSSAKLATILDLGVL